MARHGDGIYLRGNSWWLDFMHRGQRHVKRLGKGISRSVARELAAVERSAVLKGEAGIGGKKTKDCQFEKAAEEFLLWAETNKKPNTLRSYKLCVGELMKSFKGKALSQIHPFTVEKHKQDRAKAGARVRANREVALLKNIFSAAIGRKGRYAVNLNLFAGVNPVKEVGFLKESRGRLRFLSPQESGALLAAAAEPLKTMLLVGICEGLRMKSEILSLRWESVDFKRNILTVQAAYAKSGEERHVPLHPMVRTALLKLKGDAASGSAFVFAQRDGAPYRSIRTAFDTACRMAKLSDVTPHTLRHTFASELVMSGADLETIRAVGGWADLTMVQRYAHANDEHRARAISRISVDVQDSFHDAIHNAEKSASDAQCVSA